MEMMTGKNALYTRILISMIIIRESNWEADGYMWELIGQKRRTRPGNIWVFTSEGEKRWAFVCKRGGFSEEGHRRAGTPVWTYYRNPFYKTEVPALWVELGYVAEAPAPENQNQKE